MIYENIGKVSVILTILQGKRVKINFFAVVAQYAIIWAEK